MIAPTSVQHQADGVDLVAVDTPAQLLGCTFPSPELVAAAAASLSDLSVRPGWDGSEGRRAFLEVAPGLVRLRTIDRARMERRSDNPSLTPFDSWQAERCRRTGKTPCVPLEPSPETFLRGTAYFDNVEDPGADPTRPSWREVTSWSPKSRRRMQATISELDYADLFAQGVPGMVTVTYPRDWQLVAPTGKAVKRHLRILQLRWKRRWGQPMIGLWKLEFQRRGAPHVHMFVVPPGDPRVFRAWLSLTWAHIVNADPDTGERRRHVLAGTAVDYAEAARMRDPRRLAVYFLKHGTKTKDDKEYQHQVPELWRERGAGPGRFWGVWGLPKAIASVELHAEDFTKAKRLLRRWSRAQGRTRQVSVWRQPFDREAFADDDGVVLWGRRPRRRKVTRRTYQLRNNGFVGGWLSVNDGPSLAVLVGIALRT